MHTDYTAGYTQHHACQAGADLLGEVCDLGIFGLHFGLLSCKLGSEVILVAQQALTGLLQEVLLLL